MDKARESVATSTPMENVLRLALADRMVQMFDTFYRDSGSDEAALMFAMVIEQGCERFAIQVDRDALVAAIEAYWQRTSGQ